MRARSSHPRSVCACVAVSIVGLRPKPRRDMGWLNAPHAPQIFFSGRPKNFRALALDLNQKVRHTICRSICRGGNLCWLVRLAAVCSVHFGALERHAGLKSESPLALTLRPNFRAPARLIADPRALFPVPLSFSRPSPSCPASLILQRPSDITLYALLVRTGEMDSSWGA